MSGVAQKEDNCQGAEVRGHQKPLSPVPVSLHTLRGQPYRDVACDSPECWIDLPALVCLYLSACDVCLSSGQEETAW